MIALSDTRLERLLSGADVPTDALEASVRGGANVPICGDRMMLEHLPATTARELLQVLVPDAAGHPIVETLFAAAADLDVPLIGGWDGPVAKLYLNVSDASERIRTAAAAALAVPEASHAPHVIGLNISRDGTVETKVYDQWAEPPAEAPEWVRAWGALGGVVRSQRVGADGELTTRAWFVAPLDPDADAMLEPLSRLPGWDVVAVRAALPFDPGVVKSVGWSADRSVWTVYVKPRGVRATTWRLEPEVCLATDELEVALFLEPPTTERAYHRGANNALSYRTRHGTPSPSVIEPLMAWAASRLDHHEQTGAALAFTDPPEPWHVVRPQSH